MRPIYNKENVFRLERKLFAGISMYTSLKQLSQSWHVSSTIDLKQTTMCGQYISESALHIDSNDSHVIALEFQELKSVPKRIPQNKEDSRFQIPSLCQIKGSLGLSARDLQQKQPPLKYWVTLSHGAVERFEFSAWLTCPDCEERAAISLRARLRSWVWQTQQQKFEYLLESLDTSCTLEWLLNHASHWFVCSFLHRVVGSMLSGTARPPHSFSQSSCEQDLRLLCLANKAAGSAMDHLLYHRLLVQS